HQDREAAERELATYGADLMPHFQQAMEKIESAEVRSRLRRLIDKSSSTVAARELLIGRAIQVLGLSGTPDAVALLRDYAAGTPGTCMSEGATAALGRLASRK